MTIPDPLHTLLAALESGDIHARNELFDLLYSDLRSRAQGAAGDKGSNKTLQPTALVGEAFLKLTRGGASFNDRSHFLAVASKAMRQVVIDYARSHKNRHKSGSPGQIDVELVDLGDDCPNHDIERLHLALEELGSFDAAMALAIEMRIFGGSSVPETAAAVDMPQRTFERKLRGALEWLKKRMQAD